MARHSQDRRLRALEAQIGQLQRRLELHQGSADSLKNQIAKLIEKKKSLVRKGGCPHRNLEQKFTASGIAFICVDCGDPVLDVPARERGIVADSRVRDLAHHS